MGFIMVEGKEAGDLWSRSQHQPQHPHLGCNSIVDRSERCRCLLSAICHELLSFRSVNYESKIRVQRMCTATRLQVITLIVNATSHREPKELKITEGKKRCTVMSAERGGIYIRPRYRVVRTLVSGDMNIRHLRRRRRVSLRHGLLMEMVPRHAF